MAILSGIVSGLISSLVLYVILFGIKPSVNISNKICRDRDTGTYRIKIVNLSRANLSDVKYTLHAFTRTQDGIATITEIAPAKSKLEFIEAYSDTDPNKDYAVRISYDIDSQFSLNKETGLQFAFYAKHSVSGTPCFIKKEFMIDDIICGTFETEKSMKIVNGSCRREYSSCGMTCAN